MEMVEHKSCDDEESRLPNHGDRVADSGNGTSNQDNALASFSFSVSSSLDSQRDRYGSMDSSRSEEIEIHMTNIEPIHHGNTRLSGNEIPLSREFIGTQSDADAMAHYTRKLNLVTAIPIDRDIEQESDCIDRKSYELCPSVEEEDGMNDLEHNNSLHRGKPAASVEIELLSSSISCTSSDILLTDESYATLSKSISLPEFNDDDSVDQFTLKGGDKYIVGIFITDSFIMGQNIAGECTPAVVDTDDEESNLFREVPKTRLTVDGDEIKDKVKVSKTETKKSRVRLVSFDSEPPTIHHIQRAKSEDKSNLFYKPKELTKFKAEYIMELQETIMRQKMKSYYGPTIFRTLFSRVYHLLTCQPVIDLFCSNNHTQATI